MTKEFIPYQQGLQLKELGFDEPCWAWWHIEDCDIRFCYSDQRSPIINSRETEIVGLPTFSQAFKFFREEHGLIGQPIPLSISYPGKVTHYGWSVVSNQNSNDWENENDGFKSYEEAEQACLEQLIQIVNDKRRSS